MRDIVIRAGGLGKQYCLGTRAPYQTLRDRIASFSTCWRNSRRDREQSDRFWALRDVSFEVRRGEVVGIIGRNGAGKSTLLKILSRITEPTTGEADLYGRVGSLLEVGTGFHPELTGRENVYLNGAVLGMKRTEIARKFDEIVAFAEVEQFIDTAVKFYSSGMYMRLAFAVAAHLEPEILIVDEVLAVGDAAFQKKCLGKMGEVSRAGRTVLFVSHNAQAIRSLCTRAVLLEQGTVRADGHPLDVMATYERESRAVRIDATTAVHDTQYRRGSGEVRFTLVELLDDTGRPRQCFEPGDTIRLEFGYECREAVRELWFSLVLKSASGVVVTSTHHCLSEAPLARGFRSTARLDLPANPLRPGEYPLYLWLGRSSTHPFDVIDGLTEPLVITTGKDSDELGYDPTNPSGYFSITARLSNTTTPTRTQAAISTTNGD
jgi:lipopolysaccharide transport system ATP-binding protein